MSLIAPEPFTPTPPPPSVGERCGVWILEDSPLEAEMARRALASRNGVEVFTEGSMVLERIANGQTPDTLVLDWQLPGLSGLEVCRFLRSSRDEIALPILMVTCYGQKNDILEALAAGANDYLSKPYDVTELVARVGTLVRISRLYDAQQRRGRQLALAADVGVALTQGGEPADVLNEVGAAIVRHLGVSLSAIWMVESDHLVLAAAAGPLSTRELPRRASLKDHPLGHMAREGARWIRDDVHRDERLSGQTWAVDSLGTSLGYPLVVSDNILGLLVVLSPHPVLPDTINALGSVADVIALGVEKARGERERAMLLGRERKAREEAEAANRLKDEFLATVSHELRTPLHAITGWTGILQEGGVTGERAARALQTIQRNAQAQTQLIDDLLDVSRIISGKVRLDVAPTDLLGVADLALETIRPVAAAKGVRLQSILDSGVGTVLGDAGRLQQIIWNLLSNAVKFTPKGGEVKVNIHRPDSCVEITVEDNGQGISNDFLPQVFDRFRQADGGVARKQGGLGLGLAIVRHLVELHDGTIEAFSDGPGLGSRFVVRIPFAPAGRRGEVPSLEHATGTPLDFPAELVGLRILVVDDQPDARELLVMLLERCQANVTEAGSASEAFELVRTTLPDVLVSDVGMPGEDGISLIRKVRALPKAEGGHTLAVALTAYARTEDRSEALVAGFNMHVPKPIQAAELLAVLAKVASGHSPRVT